MKRILTVCSLAHMSFSSDKGLDIAHRLWYTQTKLEHKFYMETISTRGRLTILLGQRQAITGQRLSLRRLAELADVPKDLVYRLDAGLAHYVDLDALARLCHTLECHPNDILVWSDNGSSSPTERSSQSV
jgi:DNA-binding Xre family transcriptional regulator